MKVTGISILMVSVAIAALSVTASDADAKRRVERGHDGYITVTSRYDAWETISAPVRRARFGKQVRLPGGAWVDCEIDCYHTLRTQTIDYWKTQEEQGGGRD